MKLRFMDGKEIDVLRIYGGPKLIDGIKRDVLRIEVDPDYILFDDLKRCFENNPNTMVMYTDSSTVENGEPITELVELGVGYTKFISQTIENITIPHTPGKLEPDIVQKTYIVQIAQMTYDEYLELRGEKNGNNG